jgi:hypothetical protein
LKIRGDRGRAPHAPDTHYTWRENDFGIVMAIRHWRWIFLLLILLQVFYIIIPHVVMLQDDMPGDQEKQAVLPSSVSPIYSDRNTEVNVSSSLLLPGHPLQDFDFTQPAPCGKFKCFFQSKRHKDVGYLVGESIMWRMKKGWNYAQHLQDEYHIKHFMLEPPKHFKKGKNVFVEQMNRLAYRVGGGEVEDYKPFCAATDHPNASSSCDDLVIQKVQKVPNTTFFVGCGGGVGKKMNSTLAEWKSSSWFTTVQDKTVFVDQLNLEIQSLSKLMEQEPLFLYDFQLFLDRNGSLYHLDFDRVTQGEQLKKKLGDKAFQGWAKGVRESCLDLLQTLKKDIIYSNFKVS